MKVTFHHKYNKIKEKERNIRCPVYTESDTQGLYQPKDRDNGCKGMIFG